MSADGLDPIRQLRDQGEELPPLEPPQADKRGGKDEGGTARPPTLPDDVPVVPLGVNDEGCFYLDAMGQLRFVEASKHGHLVLRHMFGTKSELLYQYWPRLKKIEEKDADGNTVERWETTGFKPEAVAEALMAVCAYKGIWNPQDRVRGVGAWMGGDGELVLHSGSVLRIVKGPQPEDGTTGGPPPATDAGAGLQPWREIRPGVVDRFVYPQQMPISAPAMEHQAAGDKGPGDRLLRLFKTWNWRRPDLDPYLLLGWNCSGMLGGALPWRASAWVTGSTASGKSTLQKAIKDLFGPGGLLQSPDATAAAIRQIVRNSSIPVALDEQEAEEGDNRKINALIRLARDAATGAESFRGGQDHSAAAFTLRNSFLFSSILIPALLPQDRNRMAVLELKPLPKDAERPKVTERGMAAVGARLLRRLVQQWPRAIETIDLYRDMLAEVGFPARGQDVFGTLLGCADLALYDHKPDSDSLAAWKERMAAALEREKAAGGDDSAACLHHLLSTMIEDPRDKKRNTIGWFVARAAGHHFTEEQDEAPVLDEQKRANATLQPYGIKVHEYPKGSGLKWLAVANQHVGLAKLFFGTQWAARSGADGVWKQSLGRLTESEDQLGVVVWFGANARATLLPLKLCLPEGAAAQVEAKP